MIATRAWLLFLLVGCTRETAPPSPPPPPNESATRRMIGVGDRAPEVAPGKVTLVVFSATWSAPSKLLDERIEEIWRARRGKAFAVKAILVDDEPNYLEAWRKEHGLTYPFEWDENRRLAERYRIWTESVVFVIDREGIVRHVHATYHDRDEEQIAAEVDALLGATKPSSPSPAR